MKNINPNGQHLGSVHLVTSRFDITVEEADRIIGAKTQNRIDVVREILKDKNPNVESITSYDVDECVLKDIGIALVNRREAELKQIPFCAQ